MPPNTPPGGPNDGADPIAQLAEGAAATRQLFTAYTLVGFNEMQALYIVGVVLSATIRANTVPTAPPDA